MLSSSFSINELEEADDLQETFPLLYSSSFPESNCSLELNSATSSNPYFYLFFKF